MNILVVSPFFPLPLTSGGHTRLYNLLKHMCSKHTVDFASLVSPPERESVARLDGWFRKRVSFDPFGADGASRRTGFFTKLMARGVDAARGIPPEASGFYFPELKEAVAGLLAESRYDVVQVELTRMARCFPEDFFREHPSRKFLADYDLSYLPHQRDFECETRPARKAAKFINYRLHKSYAAKVWSLFDTLIVMSETDRKKALELIPGRDVQVVPNGVDLDAFRPGPRDARGKRLLMLGGAMHPANVDGLKYFLREIFPAVREKVPDATLYVIGTGWDALKGIVPEDGSVRLTGFLEDYATCISDESVFIAPIRIGGGTRLKILEAMALGVPVVTTRVGCEGLGAVEGTALLAADAPDEFARRVCELLLDAPLRERIAAAAYCHVKEHFSWEAIASKMEGLYDGS